MIPSNSSVPYIRIATLVHLTLPGIGSIRKRSNDPENSHTDDMMYGVIDYYSTLREKLCRRHREQDA
jgi:hypothetical protein